MMRPDKILKFVCFWIGVSLFMISCNRRIQSYCYAPQISSNYSLNDSLRNGDLIRKSIILTSDTSLNYYISLGGIGISTTINYKTIDALNIIDSVDVNNHSTFQNYTNEIFGHKFIYSKDSLVDLNNGQKYFNQRYIDKYLITKRWKNFYLIVGGKKKKITSINHKRIFLGIDMNKYKSTVLGKIEAKERFGINPKYITIELTKK